MLSQQPAFCLRTCKLHLYFTANSYIGLSVMNVSNPSVGSGCWQSPHCRAERKSAAPSDSIQSCLNKEGMPRSQFNSFTSSSGKHNHALTGATLSMQPPSPPNLPSVQLNPVSSQGLPSCLDVFLFRQLNSASAICPVQAWHAIPSKGEPMEGL